MNSLDLPSGVDRRASTTGTGGGGGGRVGSREASPPTDNAARAGSPSDLPARSAAQMARAHVTLMQSNALRAADSVSRLTATGSGSTEPVVVAAAARSPAAETGGPAAAVAVVGAPLHLTWKTWEREKFSAVSVFDCPAVSRMTSTQLASAAFKGALKSHAVNFPTMEAEFIGGAEDHLLIGLSITCGGVASADVAEQLVSRRVDRSNANLMQLVASWCQKFATENMVAAAVLGHAGVDGEVDGESDGDAEARDDTAGAADPSNSRGRGHCGGAVSDDEEGEENDY